MKFVFILLLVPILFVASFGQNTKPIKVTANGVELHYIEKGQGEPLILLHGGVGDYRSWDLQFDEFSKDYRVISYSRRYHFPNKNTPDSKYKAALTEAEDLDAFLRALKLERVHLVGHSYGGLTALVFAVKYPKAVRSLVLSEPPAHQLVRDLPGGETLYQDFMNVMKSVVESFKQGDDRKAMSIFSSVLGRDLDKMPLPLVERTMQNALAIRAINEFPEPFPKISKKKLRRLKIPTLIVTGEKTVEIHKLVNQEFLRLIPNAKESVIPNSGHIAARENPKVYNETVLKFLTGFAAQNKKDSLDVSLSNVFDAFGKDIKGVTQGWGFSSVINYKGKWILFDSGTDARIFEQNLKALKIDLRKIDIAVVSHGHYDHVGGFDYLLKVNPKVKIYAPKDFPSLGAPSKFPFRETEPDAAKTLPKEEQYFRGEKDVDGMTTVPTGRFWQANVEFLTEPKEVLPGVTLIPTVSELMGTFIKYPPFEKNPQFAGMPELSLTLATEKGDIIVSGCSHSTIETIVQTAQKTRKTKIHLLVGGFHLIPYKRDYIESLAKRLKENYNVEAIAPAHCTGQLAFSIFRKEFGDRYKFFGLGEIIKL